MCLMCLMMQTIYKACDEQLQVFEEWQQSDDEKRVKLQVT